MPGVWEAVRDYNWSGAPAQKDICEKYMAALNTHDPNQVVGLYTPTAVHITSNRTIQGTQAITGWYTSLFKQILPNATFTLTNFNGDGNSRHFTWTATSSAGKVQNGNDTFGLTGDQIGYHYSFFTVTS
jgi:ketosteroid isomerase-like protein